jgi:hypothetical protein
MTEYVIDIPPELYGLAAEELKKAQTKKLLQEAVEQKIKTLILFGAVDKILKKSALSDEKAAELAEELNRRVA